MSRRKKPISKNEFLQKHQERAWHDQQGEFDLFSQKALEGLQYHPEGEPLQVTLSRLQHKIGSNRHKKGGTIRRLMSIAAGFLVLISGIYYLYLQAPSNDTLFANHFEYIPMVVDGQTRSRTNIADDTSLERAVINAYEEMDYEKSEGLLRAYLAENPDEIDKAFYYGIILLGKGNTGAAINIFNKTLASEENKSFARAANWYLGLAYLKQDLPNEAQHHFEAIASGEDRYAVSARALLKALGE